MRLGRFAVLGVVAIAGLAVAPILCGQTGWQTSGSNTIYAPSGTKVGIGTQTPGEALSVSGNISLYDPSNTSPTLYFSDNTAFSGGLNLVGSPTMGFVALTPSGSQGFNVSGINLADRLDQSNNQYWICVNCSGTNIAEIGTYNEVSGTGIPLVLQSLGGNVGIGTLSPPSQYLLSVNGAIGAKEVVVTNTGWSDYVFQPDYRLAELRDVGAYIKDNGHLPDIPTQQEVQEKGVSLGDMQAKLLAKVEELTLYMIKADERAARLEQQNQTLQSRVAQLEQQSGAVAPAR